jgi:formylglycine-generating enzyme required for sulfatase activity
MQGAGLRIVVHSKRGERAVESADGALLVALVRASGALGVAVIGDARGAPYLQTLDGDTPVFLNGHRLAASQWLRDGDRLEIGGEAVAIRQEPGVLVLSTALDIALTPAPRSIALAPPAQSAVRRQHRVPTPLVFAALAVLGLLMWYLFSAHMVYVAIQPAPDRVSLDGALPVIPIGQGYLALSGTYRLHAERSGYKPLDRELRVTDASRQEVSFALEELPGYLSIETPGVTGAAVLIGGEVRGATPLADVALAAGEYRVIVRASNYVDYSATLRIEGRGHRQKLTATLVPSAAAVTVLSATPGAELVIDGATRGGLPFSAELSAGVHAVEIRAPGRKSWKQEITVVPAQPQTVGPINLAPADGRLQVSSEPSGASVALDGRYVGTTPVTVPVVPDRDHRVTLSLRGRDAVSRTVRVAAGQTRELSVSLPAVVGKVRLEVEPRDAVLSVEGRPYGTARGVHALPAVPQLLEITREGFAPGQLWVTPKPGFEQTLRITLRAKGAPSTEGLPERVAAPDGTVMILLHPGPFTMGASRREPGQRANERLHPVKLARPYYLGATEVTNEQFRRFRPNHNSGRYGSIGLDDPKQPVVNVRWEDAAAYCNSLNAAAGLPAVYASQPDGMKLVRPVGQGYRLPTEAEWAWAARHGGGAPATRFPWGDALPPAPRSGNFADRSIAGVLADTIQGYDDDYAGPAPVGQFTPSPAGLYDMAGNVAEWVHDVYAIQAPADAETDPTGPPSGKHHVIRGSSWMQASISALRWTFRDYGPDPRPDVGFRCARYATEAQ